MSIYIVSRRDRSAQRLAPDHTLTADPPRTYIVEAPTAARAFALAGVPRPHRGNCPLVQAWDESLAYCTCDR